MPDQRNGKSEFGIIPRPGDVYRVTRAASIQFIKPILFRVIRMHDWATYDGWAWLDGYEINAAGDAVARRSIFIMPQFLIPGRIGASPPDRRATPAPNRQEGKTR